MQRMQRGAFQRGMVFACKHHRALAVPEDDSSKKPVEAPSVAVPESIIPSADTSGLGPDGVSFQMLASHSVRLPESFRGGCSFGAGVLADLSRRDYLLQIGEKHGCT